MYLNVIESIENEAQDLLCACIGNPDQEKILSTINDYIEKPDLNLYRTDDYTGLIGIKKGKNNTIELRHISVDQKNRYKGTGSSLIENIMIQSKCSVIYLETDDDSIDFYRKCNFIVIDEGEKYPGRTRYFCIRSDSYFPRRYISKEYSTLSFHEIVKDRIYDLEQLSITASDEGHHFVNNLIDDYLSGENMFDNDYEFLIGIYKNNKCIGICGINIDPYANDIRIGRVRRLYITPKFRKHGYGELLVNIVINRSKINFDMIQLFTNNPSAANLYEKLGFDCIDDDKQSHRLSFGDSK